MSLSLPNGPYAIWRTAEDFMSGQPPKLRSESEWERLVSQARFDLGGDNMILASLDEEDWTPHVAFNDNISGRIRPLSPENFTLLCNKRRESLRVEEEVVVSEEISTNGQVQTVEVTEEPQEAQSVPVAPETEGGFFLNLSPHMAELLRDTFTLVAQGQTVTLRIQPPEG